MFEHKAYHPQWLESTTLVLHKVSKPAYDVAKAYHLIGLIDTIPNVFSTLCAKHLSYLAEKHSMLLPSQFGGRLGRNTTDAMLLVAHKIKEVWRKGKTAAALFLDVQGAFPNTIKDQLLHNMQMRRVPQCFVDIVSLHLSGWTTCIKFNDYISDLMPLDNGTTQRGPSSMLYYSFYNTPLIEIASSNDELCPGFEDDTMILAIGDSIGQCHFKLKDMMERPGRGFEWSYPHNWLFELSKTALIKFPRSHKEHIPAGLTPGQTKRGWHNFI